MNFRTLSFSELSSLSQTNQAAREYLVDNAQEVFERFDNEIEERGGYDPAGCFDDGFNQGQKHRNEQLEKLYAEDLLEWIENMPDMAIAGDADLADLEIMLVAIHAELIDAD